MDRTPYILVVDDDPDAREILNLVLNPLPVRVMEAHNGNEAQIFIHALPPLLMLLDLSMPRLDGREVLKWLRSRPDGNRIPVIIFTAHHVDDALLAELRMPRDRVVRKGSTSMNDLKEKVMRLLGPGVVNVEDRKTLIFPTGEAR